MKFVIKMTKTQKAREFIRKNINEDYEELIKEVILETELNENYVKKIFSELYKDVIRSKWTKLKEDEINYDKLTLEKHEKIYKGRERKKILIDLSEFPSFSSI